jgi:glycosyltransferase involved in cell wall biosynthesis
MTSNGKKVSAIVPAFNEEAGLAELLPELIELDIIDEIIVVDDGSEDGTSRVVEEFPIKLIRHTTNMGYGAALKTGFRKAGGDIIVTLDGDGQHSASDISRLLSKLDEDTDMVVGDRGRSGSPRHRAPGKRLLSVLANFLVEQEIPDINSGLRAVWRERVMEFLHIYPNGFSLSTTCTLAFLKAGYNVKYLPIEAIPRAGGTSTVGYFRDGVRTILLMLRCIMLFNPLKVFAPVSIAMLAMGSVYLVIEIMRTGGVPDGAVLAILSGIITLLFGLLGDQISLLNRRK